MSNHKLPEKLILYPLMILLFFVAINAFGGGYYGMAGAKDVPIEWLENSPFHSYFIPSLILFICVGGSALFAAIALFRKQRLGRNAAFVCGIIIIIWLTVQMAIIGYVSWMQPATGVAAIIILLLTWQLPDYGH